MRHSISEFNKSQCRTCYHKKIKSTDSPCDTCEYILTGFGTTVGNNHSEHNATIVVVRKDLDMLMQRVEELEHQRLTGCLCRNSIVTATIDKRHVPKNIKNIKVNLKGNLNE